MKSETKMGTSFTSAQLEALKRRIGTEIFGKIIPHLNGKADHGYPFRDNKGLQREALCGELDVKLHLEMIERGAACMGNFGEAFKYAVYHDLNQLLAIYEELAWEHELSSIRKSANSKAAHLVYKTTKEHLKERFQPKG